MPTLGELRKKMETLHSKIRMARTSLARAKDMRNYGNDAELKYVKNPRAHVQKLEADLAKLQKKVLDSEQAYIDAEGDPVNVNAATKIQAHVRGHQTRKRGRGRKGTRRR
jgi:hypothetical protein